MQSKSIEPRWETNYDDAILTCINKLMIFECIPLRNNILVEHAQYPEVAMVDDVQPAGNQKIIL